MPRQINRLPSKWLVIEAYACLAFVHLLLAINGYRLLRALVSRYDGPKGRKGDIASLISAMQYARCLYVKTALCLHWCAATTLYLRRHGWPVTLTMGVQHYPFVAHAWIELNGNVVAGTVNRDKYVPIDSF